MGRGIEIHGVFLVVPHHQIARCKKVFYCTAITAVRDAQPFLHISRAECKWETILVAAQVEIQAEGYAGQFDEGFFPFINGDL